MTEFHIPLPAKLWLDRLNELYEQAPQLLEDARKANDDNHVLFQRAFHNLERAGSFSASEGYAIAKGFQDVLIKRRQAKWDATTWEIVAKFVQETRGKLNSARATVTIRSQSAEEYIRNGVLSERDEDTA